MTVVTDSIPQQRSALVGLPDLEAAWLPTQPFVVPSRDLPSWASFTADDRTLVVAVPTDTSWQRVEAALAYGLFHAGEREGHVARDLTLVLPTATIGERDGLAASLIRSVMIDKRVTIRGHDGRAVGRPSTMSRDQALDALRGDPTEISDTLGNLRSDQRVQELVRWVRGREELHIAHRPGYLAWHCGGRQVLQVRPGKKKAVVIAGSNAGIKHGHLPLNVPVTEQLTADELSAIKVHVLEAIVDRLVTVDGTPKDNGHAEHRLQGMVASSAERLGWQDDLALRREFPVYRPGGGRGFIDFLRLDRDRVLHIVETKLGHDEKLVLQGLDYWMWATANRDALGHVFNEGIERIVVDYVVGKKDGKPFGAADKPLSPYAQAHLALLSSSIRQTVYAVDGWTPVAATLTLARTETVGG